MKKKKSADEAGYVYSTDPDFMFRESGKAIVTPEPSKQNLQVRLETKQRAGKAVTLVLGFTGTDEDFETLGKKLKTFCGTGGSAKDGEIIIQGDQREKVKQFLTKNGYKFK